MGGGWAGKAKGKKDGIAVHCKLENGLMVPGAARQARGICWNLEARHSDTEALNRHRVQAAERPLPAARHHVAEVKELGLRCRRSAVRAKPGVGIRRRGGH